jgi:DNA-binding NarL/FixJ family response regulator
LLRVLLVDGSLAFRRFVRGILEQKQDYSLVGEVSDGLEAVQKAEELQPDLIVLAISLPKLNGIEAAKRIHQIVPGAKVLFLTVKSSADVVQAALSSGGQGYVLKTDAEGELWPAIEAVLQGKQYVSSGVGGLLGFKAAAPGSAE